MKKTLCKAVVAIVAVAISASAYGTSQIARIDTSATKFLVPTQREWKSMPSMQRSTEKLKMQTSSIR